MNLEFAKESVAFRMLKPVLGIPSSEIVDGIYKTRKLKKLAMLRRLPDNHVQEITDDFAEEAEPQIDLTPSQEEIKRILWFDLTQLAERYGVYKVGVTRVEMEEAVLGQYSQVGD